MLSPKALPAQLAAAAPLTGGHANKYRRGVQVDEMRGLATVGHGGLWPGYRTEFLRVPQADLTVVVIANLGSIDPWRQARAIAMLALEGDKRLKPALPTITEAEIKSVSGAWFNAEEPSLFDLAWRNGEATVTQNGCPSCWDGAPTAGWRPNAVRSIALKPGRTGTARVDLGAGRVLTFKKLGRRKSVPAAIAGRHVSADTGASWEIKRSGERIGPLPSAGR